MKRALEYRGYRDAKKFPVPSGIARVNLCSESRQLQLRDALRPTRSISWTGASPRMSVNSTRNPNPIQMPASPRRISAATLVLRNCRCPHPIGIRRLPTGASCPLPRSAKGRGSRAAKKERNHPEAPLTCAAYFSMEFMLSEALPIYSGGLGNVAGDQLKAASDLGVPVVGVGLLYQQGYFRQVIDNKRRAAGSLPL